MGGLTLSVSKYGESHKFVPCPCQYQGPSESKPHRTTARTPTTSMYFEPLWPLQLPSRLRGFVLHFEVPARLCLRSKGSSTYHWSSLVGRSLAAVEKGAEEGSPCQRPCSHSGNRQQTNKTKHEKAHQNKARRNKQRTQQQTKPSQQHQQSNKTSQETSTQTNTQKPTKKTNKNNQQSNTKKQRSKHKQTIQELRKGVTKIPMLKHGSPRRAAPDRIPPVRPASSREYLSTCFPGSCLSRFWPEP